MAKKVAVRKKTTKPRQKPVSRKDISMLAERTAGAKIKDIAKRHKVHRNTVGRRCDLVLELLGVGEAINIDLIRERMIRGGINKFFDGLLKALKRGDSGAINGFARGIGLYQEKSSIDLGFDGTDDELRAAQQRLLEDAAKRKS